MLPAYSLPGRAQSYAVHLFRVVDCRDCTFDSDTVVFHDMWGKPAVVYGTGRTRRIVLTGEPLYFTGGRLLSVSF